MKEGGKGEAEIRLVKEREKKKERDNNGGKIREV